MSIKFNFSSSLDLDKLQKSMDERLTNMQRVIGRELARKTAEEVKGPLPTTHKWQKIYKDSIQFLESTDGMSWAVAGLAKIDLQSQDEGLWLVRVTSTSAGGAILGRYNNGTWPIDLLPAYVYGDSAVARTASESDVNDARSRLASRVPNVVDLLDSEGVAKSKSGNPVFTDGEYFDLEYMARAMEVGADGHKRTPHWEPAKAKLLSNADSWAKGVHRDINSVMVGNDIDAPEGTMDATLRKKLEDIRESTWP